VYSGGTVRVQHLPRQLKLYKDREWVWVHGLRVPLEHAGPCGREPGGACKPVLAVFALTVDGQLRSFLQKPFTPQALIAKLQDLSVRNVSGGSRALLLRAAPPRKDD
jgi:hypothetical protein